MNKDPWIALVIAIIITITAATPLYYSRDYARGPKDKISEGADTKMTEPMKETKENTKPTLPILEGTE